MDETLYKKICLPHTVATVLGSIKIRDWNKAYPTNDKSVITAINSKVGIIKIKNPGNNKQIEMQITTLPEDWQTRNLISLVYHPRISQWSADTIELLEAKYDKDRISNHTFPHMVDFIIQHFGESQTFFHPDHPDNPSPQLIIAGRIIHTDTKESVSGQFEYTFFEIDTRKILYHRFFRPHKFYRPHKFHYNKLHISRRGILPSFLRQDTPEDMQDEASEETS